MSYDVSLVIDTGSGEAVEIGDGLNYTYNMSYALTHGGICMYRPRSGEPTAGLVVLDGLSAPAAAAILAHCIDAIERDADDLRKREPANGWGSVDGLVRDFLRPLLERCRQHPRCTVRVT